MWKFKSWKGKDKWLFLLTIGVIFAFWLFRQTSCLKRLLRMERRDIRQKTEQEIWQPRQAGQKGRSAMAGAMDLAAGDSLQKDAVMAAADVKDSYEAELERRVKEILKMWMEWDR